MNPFRERIRQIFLLIPIVAMHFQAASQDQKIDSLKSLLKKTSEEQYVDVLFELARAYSETDYDQCLYFSNKAYNAANELGDTWRIVKTTRGKAQVYRRLGKLDSAVYLFERILPVAKSIQYTQEIKTILNALGIGYLYMARYDKALTCFFESLEMREKDNDKYEIGVISINIALTYYKLLDYQTALKYFSRSHRLYSELGNVPYKEMVTLYLNLSKCYAHLGDHITAAEIIKKAFTICSENCPNLLKMAVYQESAVILLLQGDYQNSKDHFLKSYELSSKSSEAQGHFENLIGLTRVYTSLNQLDSAEKYLSEAEQIIALGSDFKYEMSVVYSKLASTYVEEKNFEKATSYLLKYKNTNDSIFNQRLTTNLMKIEADHIEKQSKAQIESQKKILALNRDIIERQKQLNIFVGIVAVLLIALAIILLRNNRQKQRLNSLLDHRVRERTQELQLSRDALHRAFHERELLITTTVTKINTSLATLKGLCLLGSYDKENAREYLKRVSFALDDIRHVVARTTRASVSEPQQ